MTGIHDNLNVAKTVHYCKSDVKTGKPLVIADMIKGTKRNTKKWKMDLFDEDGMPVRLQCIFGKPNRNGARAILEILR